MKDYQVQVVIPHTNALPRDSIVNTFSFRGPDVTTEGVRADLKARLIAFYTAVQTPGTASLVSFMSNQMNRDGTRLKAYDRLAAKPRAPMFDELMQLSAGGASGTAGPHELACCLSFHAPKISGVNQARQRGRIYFGPLSTNAYSVAGGDSRPVGGLINALRGAGIALAQKSDAVWLWGVWSQYTGHVTVTNGWVDDTIDIQRRRGLKATSRNTW